MQAASRWASRKQAKILRNLSVPAPAVKRCVSIPRGDTVQAKILDFGLARLTPAGAGLPLASLGALPSTMLRDGERSRMGNRPLQLLEKAAEDVLDAVVRVAGGGEFDGINALVSRLF